MSTRIADLHLQSHLVLLTSFAYSEHLRSALTAGTPGGRSTIFQNFFGGVFYFFLAFALKTISFHFGAPLENSPNLI